MIIKDNKIKHLLLKILQLDSGKEKIKLIIRKKKFLQFNDKTKNYNGTTQIHYVKNLAEKLFCCTWKRTSAE